jgi:hypothetical protein
VVGSHAPYTPRTIAPVAPPFFPRNSIASFFADEQNNFWSKDVRSNDARLDPDLINNNPTSIRRNVK